MKKIDLYNIKELHEYARAMIEFLKHKLYLVNVVDIHLCSFKDRVDSTNTDRGNCFHDTDYMDCVISFSIDDIQRIEDLEEIIIHEVGHAFLAEFDKLYSKAIISASEEMKEVLRQERVHAHETTVKRFEKFILSTNLIKEFRKTLKEKK